MNPEDRDHKPTQEEDAVNNEPENTVAAIIVDKRSSGTWILLTLRDHDPFRGYWCLPGGHIDPGEAQIEAIRREVREETSLDFKPCFFGAFDELIPEHEHHHLLHVFEGSATGKPQIRPEVADFRWFPLEEARQLPLAFRHNQVLDAYAHSKMPAERREELLAEYGALREEVLKRIELRYQSLNLAIAATGLFVGAVAGGLVPPITLLLYPPLALCITIAWSHSDIRISQIAEYVMEQIEQPLSGINWEHWLRKRYDEVPHPVYRRFTELSALGVFMGTQILTMLVAVFVRLIGVTNQLPLPSKAVLPVYAFLIVADAILVYMTYRFVRLRRR
jgi:8-oxo-dGTP diphosphatase